MAKKSIDINQDVIEQCLQGDRQAQFRLYSLYADKMLNVAHRMTNSREEAEDILQESFIDAFTRLNTFRFEASFGSWLKRIVVNKTINRYRMKKPELTFIESYDFFQVPDLETTEDYPDNLTVEKVKNAMNDLPEGARIVFDLYLFEGYQHAQIADVLNISVSTSKTQYRYAKLKIREYLKEEVI
ncbi:RNA polymerase sigma factor [Saccharicrinis sp. FJH62]|uniref:RNA polymerase sigma factor n=1 Tax=Saccharicrinis sp. FJH62 TaxID=3344657 RepID=UPI0035D4F923